MTPALILRVCSVIQNNLQYVAASNLDAATFQVTYQMKILTTAFFSVLMLRKRLSPVKWAALIFLALGVGVVQVQSGAGHASDVHTMFPFKGFLAVTAACFTSGLAGVYFEMVLKGSQADLWVRNVQLSLFSLLPALVPIVWSGAPREAGAWFGAHLFRNFGPWAWATVAIQVFGGLITALVIKFADNILKGFATSLSIVISFLASVALFDMQLTFSFMLGSSIVLVATWLYNQPEAPRRASGGDWGFMARARPASALGQAGLAMSQAARKLSASSLSLTSLASLSAPPSPTEDALLPTHQPPSLFDADRMDDKLDKPVPQSFMTVAAAFGIGSSPPPPQHEGAADLGAPSVSIDDDFRSHYAQGQHCFLAPSLSRGSSSQRLPSRAHSPDLLPAAGKAHHALSATRPPSRLASSTSAPGS
jgi:UDP-galactose transporter